MKEKFVFNTEEQRESAVQARGLSLSETAMLGNDYCTISRPEGSNLGTAPLAYIFWTKDSPEDDKPTYEKVVCEYPGHA